MDTLIRTIQRGDTQAFRLLIERIEQPLFGFLVARVHDREVAKDAFQDVCVELYTSLLGRFVYHSEPQTFQFVFVIARRVLAKQYEKHARYMQHKTSGTPVESDAGAQAHTTVARAGIEHAVERLPESYRQLVELRYWSGLTLKEIAHITGSELSAVKVRHHRALQKLKELYV